MKKVSDYVEGLKEYAISTLGKLISIPTVNPPGGMYVDAANFLKDELEGIGLDVDLIEIPDSYLDRHYPYSPQHKGHRRLIVYGRLGNRGPRLHFNGHYDVVPAGGGWRFDPFKPTIIDGKVYGRGANDMKGGITSILMMLKVLVKFDLISNGTLEVAFVPDEESSGIGTKYLVEECNVIPDYVVVAEPSGIDRLAIGHKGLVRGMVKIKGRQAHASMPWIGDNAFVKASELIVKFKDRYEKILSSRRTTYPVDVPKGLYPTINLGGYAESTSRKESIVPGEFIFSIDRRTIPEEDPLEVEEELKHILIESAKEVGAEIDVNIITNIPAAAIPIDSKIVRFACGCIKGIIGKDPRVGLSLGRTDLGYYIFKGSKGIMYGPGKIEGSHTTDEYVELDDIIVATKVFVALVTNFMAQDA
ncbi:MAG: M20 family metallopeptidase [Nitrososphaerota archaeon]|nr:M20 family metallopeptidase [Nitrososphaerales archaeon]MDW8045289.1 M20 family metallopeptidase [Nitrososphaerota archaeon]